MEWILPAIISAITALGVAWLGKRASERAEKTRATVPLYDSLSDEVRELRDDVRSLWAEVRSLTGDLDTVVDALWEQVQRPGSPIARRALSVMHRCRAERAEAAAPPPDDGQDLDPTA